MATSRVERSAVSFPCLRRERLEARIGLGFQAEYRQAEWKIPVSRMETRQRRESSCGESSNVKVSEPEEGGVSDRVDNLKVAVITGAAQGIGRRTAEVLARKGFTVALNDLRPPAEAVRSVAQAGGHVLEFAGDITEEQVVLRLCDAVLQRWGRCDVLVNNAGISFIAPAERIAVEDFRRVLEVNLVAPFLLAKAFGALMLKQGSGTIINVASIAGLLGIADRAACPWLASPSRTTSRMPSPFSRTRNRAASSTDTPLPWTAAGPRMLPGSRCVCAIAKALAEIFEPAARVDKAPRL